MKSNLENPSNYDAVGLSQIFQFIASWKRLQCVGFTELKDMDNTLVSHMQRRGDTPIPSGIICRRTDNKKTNKTTKKVRLDVSARDFWVSAQKAFFDVKGIRIKR